MEAERYYVTYTGAGVVSLPRAGVFQTGTRACVDREVARAARALPGFVVDGPEDAERAHSEGRPDAGIAAAEAEVRPADMTPATAPAPVDAATEPLAPAAPAPVAAPTEPLAPAAPAPVDAATEPLAADAATPVDAPTEPLAPAAPAPVDAPTGALAADTAADSPQTATAEPAQRGAEPTPAAATHSRHSSRRPRR